MKQEDIELILNSLYYLKLGAVIIGTCSIVSLVVVITETVKGK